jgi:hypothetical protein
MSGDKCRIRYHSLTEPICRKGRCRNNQRTSGKRKQDNVFAFERDCRSSDKISQVRSRQDIGASRQCRLYNVSIILYFMKQLGRIFSTCERFDRLLQIQFCLKRNKAAAHDNVGMIGHRSFQCVLLKQPSLFGRLSGREAKVPAQHACEILDNRQRGHQLHWTGRAGAIPDGLDQHSCRGPAPPPAPRQQAGHQNVDIQCQTENPVFAYWRQSLTASASL